MFDVVNRLSQAGAVAPWWQSGVIAPAAAAWRSAQRQAERRLLGAGLLRGRGRSGSPASVFWPEVAPVEAGWELDGYWLVWAPGPTPLATEAPPWNSGERAYAEACEAEIEAPGPRLDARA